MAYDVTITRLSLRALFEIKGNASRVAEWCGNAIPALPALPNRLVEAGEHRLIQTGGDRWLLMAPLEDEQALATVLRPEAAPCDLSVVLLSDALTFFAVTGPEAGEVMLVATPLDLHQAAFPPDGASWTEAFGTRALIRRIADGYEIAVDRSYGDWFEASLLAVAS